MKNRIKWMVFGCVFGLLVGLSGCAEKKAEPEPTPPPVEETDQGKEDLADKFKQLADERQVKLDNKQKEIDELASRLEQEELKRKNLLARMRSENEKLANEADQIRKEVEQARKEAEQARKEAQAVRSAAEEKERKLILPAEKEEKSAVPAQFNVVYFDFDKSNIKSEFKMVIEENYKWIKDNPNRKILLEGHADERGSNEYNLALGERRAKSVFNYLIAMGANPEQFIVVSYGEERPASEGHTEASWKLNRRVEFTLL